MNVYTAKEDIKADGIVPAWNSYIFCHIHFSLLNRETLYM